MELCEDLRLISRTAQEIYNEAMRPTGTTDAYLVERLNEVRILGDAYPSKSIKWRAFMVASHGWGWNFEERMEFANHNVHELIQ